MNKILFTIGLVFIGTSGLAETEKVTDCPIAFTLSAPTGKMKELASIVLTAQYTNIGTNTISVYDRMPNVTGLWFYWTRLMISTGQEFKEVRQKVPLIGDIPYAEPILLAPGQSHEFSIQLKDFHFDLKDMPTTIRICARYVVRSPLVPKHQSVWTGTVTSNVVTIEMEEKQ